MPSPRIVAYPLGALDKRREERHAYQLTRETRRSGMIEGFLVWTRMHRSEPIRGGDVMPRYVIERDIPAIGTAEREALRDAAHKSNAVLAAMQAEQKHIQWEHSYVAADKTFCIYIADNETLVHEH